MTRFNTFPRIDLQLLDLQKEQNFKERLMMVELFSKKIGSNQFITDNSHEKSPRRMKGIGELTLADLQQLQLQKQKNFKERLSQVSRYAAWILSVSNDVWSHQQAKIINRHRN